MEAGFFIRPGVPDDDNRDYLPEKCKWTDIVVNENGNNSIVMPDRIIECHGVICDGLEDEWYVYVPESYDGTKEVPLVVGLHGGLMSGWGHSIYTSWCLVADRENFICLFPNAHSKGLWQVMSLKVTFSDEKTPGLPKIDVPDKLEDNHDMNMIRGLIEKMQQEYRIDKGRIFIQGMSMGNLMTSQFTRNCGEILAGCAEAAGPSEPFILFNRDGSLKNKAGALPVWHTRPELNGALPMEDCDEATVTKLNRYYWMKLNECELLPEIALTGEHNFAFYKGRKADYVFLDIKNRDHGQALDEAFLYWDYLFSGVRRREDGTIEQTASKIERKGDAFAIAAAEGQDKVWFRNKVCSLPAKAVWWQKIKYHGLNGGQLVKGEYLCLPLKFLAEAFDAEYESLADGHACALYLKDGRRLQFARGSILCAIDDTARQMYCECIEREGELLVSCEWFAAYLFDMHVSTVDHVVYITDHHMVLSLKMADLIRDILMGVPYIEPKEFKCVRNQPDVIQDVYE